MNKLSVNFIFLIIFCISCNSNKTNISLSDELNTNDKMVNLKEDFKVSNTKEIDMISYKIYHISEKSLQELYNETTDEYANFSCFYFDIELKNYDDIVSYPSSNYLTLNDKIQYLSFFIKDDFKIESNGKIYKCLNSTYDRTYGKSASTRFFLIFDKIERNNILFKYDDTYFNNGLIQLKLNI